MIQKSYSKNYFKTYFWQGLALILNMMSMLIVIPYITKEPATYGIYSVCISVSIFLAYADLGFIGAGQKYAAEYLARNERVEEVKVTGFTCFILLVFLCLLSLIFLFISYNPDLIIKGLLTNRDLSVASSLFLIQALFTPVTFLQRLIQIIYGIRIESYITQRANIIANIIKIFSVLWFFRVGHYNVVGYYMFTQVLNLLAAIVTIVIAKKRYNYDFKLLLMSLKFNSLIFNKTKKLAFSSLFITLNWILYYELDNLVIGKFSGVGYVSIYAIGLTVLTLFRNIFSILFSPFDARFNHFIGINDIDGLRKFYFNIVRFTVPIVIVSVMGISLFAEPLVLSWVGNDYIQSVSIVKIIVLSNLFAFISYPTSSLLMAQERMKELNTISFLKPLLYWIGIGITYSFLGLKAFALFKFMAFFSSAVFLYFIMKKFLNINHLDILKKIFSPLFLPITVLILVSQALLGFAPTTKSFNCLLINIIIVITSFTLSFLSLLITSKEWRMFAYDGIKSVLKAE